MTNTRRQRKQIHMYEDASLVFSEADCFILPAADFCTRRNKFSLSAVLCCAVLYGEKGKIEFDGRKSILIISSCFKP
ncbi:hypothetical protein CR513_13420, partial [Mucuna pruriens]